MDELNWFQCETFRFTLKVTSLMVLPPYKGAVFRGAFNNAFRRVVCVMKGSDCTDCLLKSQCLYPDLFEPRPPQDFPDALKYEKPPPPYVINPPLTKRQAFLPGASQDFELVLIGRAVNALPYFIYTFKELGRRGMGRERGEFDLLGVDFVSGAKTVKIYDGSSQTLASYSPAQESGFLPDEGPVNSILVRLLTPLRIKIKGKLATQLTFPLFFERLVQRLALLSSFYGNRTAACDFSDLTQRAQQVETVSTALRWYDWGRYSSRQSEFMKLGGLRGRIGFGGELGAFMPYLRLGERVNVGQGTSFGLGRYQIEISDSSQNLDLKGGIDGHECV